MHQCKADRRPSKGASFWRCIGNFEAEEIVAKYCDRELDFLDMSVRYEQQNLRYVLTIPEVFFGAV